MKERKAHFVKDELHNIGLDVRTTDVDHELIKEKYIPMPEDTSYVDRPNVYGTLKGSGVKIQDHYIYLDILT